MFDGGEGWGGMMPSIEYMEYQLGIHLDPALVLKVADLFTKVKSVVAGDPFPKTEIIDKVVCSNIMPFFRDFDQYN